MVYIMSDLHGCFDKYKAMLEKIQLKPEDTLYVLGDVVDRGPDGIKILLDMADRDNVVFLRGNHDHLAYRILRCLFDPTAEFDEDKLHGVIKLWTSDGGDATLEQFLAASTEDKNKVLAYFAKSKLSAEIEVNGIKYLLAHTVPEKELMLGTKKLPLKYYIHGEPDYELQYYDDKIIVTGHTPTSFIGESYAGRIYIKNNHIAMDCGAVFKGGRLGCICLDTMEEYYV